MRADQDRVIEQVLPFGASTHSRSPTPWRRLAHLALLGTMTMTLLVLWDVHRTGATPSNLIQGGKLGPAHELLERDFPEIELGDTLGLDGQQFYAMARSPIHLDDAAVSLDRPAYRWQRPLLPWLARVLHPAGGGGAGLVAALFAVGVLSLFVGGVAAGALSTALGGRTWPAAVVPLLPGAYMSLRTTGSDSLSMALVLVALALSAHRRAAVAVLAGCLAVLARETAVLVFMGWAVARRTRADTVLAVVPTLLGGAWAVWLRVTLSRPTASVTELGPPLVGLRDAITGNWLQGGNRLGMCSTVGAIVVAVLALRRGGRRHVLFAAVAVQLGFVSLMSKAPLGNDFGGTRTTYPLLVLSLLCGATAGSALARSQDVHRPRNENPAGVTTPLRVATRTP